MQVVTSIHVTAGGLALVAGYAALLARKGGRLHRGVGRWFAYAMLTTAIVGLAIAVSRGVAPAVNVPASLLTAYLVVTSLMTLRPPRRARPWQFGALGVALAVAASSLVFAAQAIAGGGTRNGMPAFPFLLFGVVAAIASAGDIRAIRSGNPTGARRIARHLWRMCFALFIAALSFFIGQSDELPEPLRIIPLLVIPVLAVLAAMAWWLWRVRRPRGLPAPATD
jgi:uncharacterized membrane protein